MLVSMCSEFEKLTLFSRALGISNFRVNCSANEYFLLVW
jgi:hypothetical protein